MLDRVTFILCTTLTTLNEPATVTPSTVPHRFHSDYPAPRLTPVINAAYVAMPGMLIDFASALVDPALEHDGTEFFGLVDVLGKVNDTAAIETS